MFANLIKQDFSMRQKYPKGNQDFQKIREQGYVYIDKTRLIYDLVSNNDYVFLSRPRRFGKSLLLSTIKAYFEGRKELFLGLDIYDLEKEWVNYPVLNLELSRVEPNNPQSLRDALSDQFLRWENKYNCPSTVESFGTRFANIIRGAYTATDKRVVVLIDEYDNPFINAGSENQNCEENRELLKSVYANLKANDCYIRFAMLTGVSRFGKMSIFSGLNNITDITFYDRYSEICGFTQKEIKDNLWEGVERLALNYEMEPTEALEMLKDEYDGYHFSKKCVDLYIPYSLLLALDKEEIEPFWMETATPEFLVNRLKSSDITFVKLFNDYADQTSLAEVDTSFMSSVALLFQTGYLTIKGFDYQKREYKLGIPNREVRLGLFSTLLTHLLEKDRNEAKNKVIKMATELEKGNPNEFLSQLQTFLASVPYTVIPKFPELYFEHAIYIILQLMDLESYVEVETSFGRIDLLIKTQNYIYIIEIKVDKDGEKALTQINKKEYSLSYKYDNRKIFKIGVNFSTKTRNIKDWTIETG